MANNTPEVRFEGFSGDWEERRLGEIVNITMGQSPNGENYTKNPENYILVQGNADIKNGWVTPRVWTTQVTKTADKGDLILSVRAPVGDVGRTLYNVVLGRGVAGIKGNEFIFQTLIKMKSSGYWTKYSTGSTFESINSNDLKDACIKLPEEKEQTKIGSFFKQLDDTIALQQQELDTLKQTKQGFLQKMFPKEGEKVPEVRFPRFSGAWEDRKFESMYNVISGFAFKLSDYVDYGVHIINGESINHGNVDSSSWNYLPESYIEKYSDFLLRTNDIVVGLNRPITGGELKIAQVPDYLNNSLLYQRAGKIEVIADIDKNFTYHLLNKEIHKFALKEAQGSDQPFISTSKLKKWSFYVPKNDTEQTQIGSFFKQLDDTITLHQQELDALKETKKAFLQKMFV